MIELREILGSKMYLYIDDVGISQQLMKKGIREEAATKIVQEELKPGMVVLDIGANLGYYALLESRLVGEKGKVYAIEPVPDNIKLLKKSIEENGYTNIETFQLAMGNSEGEQELQLTSGTNWGTMMDMSNATEFYRNRLKKYATDKITVPTTTVDKFVEEHGIERLDFIRMDVEGFEIEVIEGMLKTLKSMPSMKLLVEFHYSHFNDPHNVFEPVYKKLFGCGFNPKYVIPSIRDDVLPETTRYNLSDRIKEAIPVIGAKCPHIFFEKKPLELSLLIPFKASGPEWERIFGWTIKRYKKILPEAEIVIGEDDTKGEWCKSRAVNNAAKKAVGDIFLIADIDRVLTREDILKGIEALNEYPLVVPYSEYGRINKEKTEQILSRKTGRINPSKEDMEVVRDVRRHLGGGFQIVRREVFFAAGGYDERFIGWGGEDTAFPLAVESLFGKGIALEGMTYHLWHPQQDSREKYKDSPNKKLYEMYKGAAKDKKAMKKLISGELIKEKRKLKIVSCVNSLGTRMGGAEIALLTLSYALADRGHKVNILVNEKEKGLSLPLPVHILERKKTIELFKKADIVITQGKITGDVVKCARHCKVAHYAHGRDHLKRHVPDRKHDLVIYCAKWLQEREKHKISVVLYPLVFTKDYKTTPGERITLINLTELKGARVFWKLAELMPKHKFLAVKGGWGKQIIPKTVPPNVKVMEYVQDARKIYGQTRILLAPSFYEETDKPLQGWTETWGRVVIEAASSGIPTIAHPAPGLLESLGGSGIFCDRDNISAWVEAIKKLDKPETYAKFSEMAVKRAEEVDDITRRQLDETEDALIEHVETTYCSKCGQRIPKE